MFCKNRKTLHLFGRHVLCPFNKYCNILSRTKSTRNNQTEDIVRNKLGITFFIKNFGSTYKKWHVTLDKYPELKALKEKDILNTFKYLRKLNFTVNDILQKPVVLYNSELTLRNRYNIMKEIGVEDVNIVLLAKYVAFINRSSADLKYFGYLPLDANVKDNLRQAFKDIDLKFPDNKDDDRVDESTQLRFLRQIILNCYLKQKLNMTDSDIQKVWKVYPRVRHKSFTSVQNIVKLLLNDLKFPKERISKNAFVLYADAENVQNIMQQIPNIAGHPIDCLLRKRPKILMYSCDALLATLKNIKDFGLDEESVIRCLEVLTLSPDTVLERLKDMNEIEEFRALKSNPRILHLIHYRNKARLRLEYLNQLKVRCTSLHILSCGSEAFAKFARDGTDHNSGCDTVVYLAKAFNKEESNIRSVLCRHPNWRHVPLTQIKQCLEFLLTHFSIDDIYNNIHVLLYPINRIDEKLQQILSQTLPKKLRQDINIQIQEINRNDLLKLVLYLIESEYHFTGDGMWLEQLNQQVENFHNLLPDFPEALKKSYRYGHKSQNIKEIVI